jgi:hypothetical protein
MILRVFRLELCRTHAFGAPICTVGSMPRRPTKVSRSVNALILLSHVVASQHPLRTSTCAILHATNRSRPCRRQRSTPSMRSAPFEGLLKIRSRELRLRQEIVAIESEELVDKCCRYCLGEHRCMYRDCNALILRLQAFASQHLYSNLQWPILLPGLQTV